MGKRITPEQMQREQRRTQVAKLHLRGWNQYRIADELHVTQGTISNDIKAIRKDWLASRVNDHNVNQCRELAHIEQVEAEAWAEWERSKENAESIATEEMELSGVATSEAQQASEMLVSPDSLPFVAPTKIKTRKESKGRLADARYLQVINQCRDDRCKILGLYPSQLPINWDVLKRLNREQMIRVANGEDILLVLAASSQNVATGDGCSGCEPVMH